MWVSIAMRGLAGLLCLNTQFAGAQPVVAPARALALKYPEIVEQGNLSRLPRVPDSALVHVAAIQSGRWWIVSAPGIAGNLPLIRMVVVSNGKLDEYFVVCDGGAGMAATEVFGPVNLNLAEFDPQLKLQRIEAR